MPCIFDNVKSHYKVTMRSKATHKTDIDIIAVNSDKNPHEAAERAAYSYGATLVKYQPYVYRGGWECIHADTCLPDYWGGHHLAHVQIPAIPGMTLADIKAALRDEVTQGAVMGSNDDAILLSCDWVPERLVKQAEATLKGVYRSIENLRPTKKGQRKFFTDITIDEDEDCSVYAFFVFKRKGE